MTSTRLLWLSPLLGVSLLTGCGLFAPPPDPSFHVQVAAEGDPGHPLAGVGISVVTPGRAEVKAETKADGKATLDLRGRDGEQVTLDVKCPADYQSPKSGVPITLRHIATPMYPVRCIPLKRHVMIAFRGEIQGGRVKGEGQPLAGLKVKVNGQERGVTDESGAVSIVCDVDLDQRLSVQVDSSIRPDLKPEQEQFDLAVTDHDEVFPVGAMFFSGKKPPAKPTGPVHATPKGPVGPINLGGATPRTQNNGGGKPRPL